MSAKKVILFILFAVLFSVSLSHAGIDNRNLEKFPALAKLLVEKNESASQKDRSFWDDARRGWFITKSCFFDSDEPREEEKEMDISIDWDGFKKLTAKEMNEFIEELKDYAVTYPSKLNVQHYMTAQKIAAGKAKVFMTAWMDVLRDHPALDETVKRPPSSFVSFNLANAKGRAVDAIVKELATNLEVGLVFFYSRDNYYAAIQVPIFNRFLEKTGWRPYKFIDVEENPLAAANFGIETVPEIWLAAKDGRKVRVTAGVRTMDVIKEKIVAAYEQMTGKKRVNDPFKFQDTELYRNVEY